MNGHDILASLRSELALQLRSHSPPPPNPLDISPWLGMALLQKAVRRGHREFALQAAATLLRHAPDKFWRRCAVMAFEDVGIGDLDLVSRVTASLAGKSFRSELNGEWAVGSYLVGELINAKKCRAADDLLLVAERHPAHERTRLSLTYSTIPELLRIVDGPGPLPKQAIALWYGMGTDRCPSPQLRTRKGAPQTIFDAMCEAGWPHTLVEVSREGYRRTGQVLCPLLMLLATVRPSEPTEICDDSFPPEMMCGVLPSWALDVYSREGQRALKRFLRRQCGTARWVRKHIPPAQQVQFLGSILFAVEGGMVKRRYRWPIGDELRRLSELESQGPHCANATEIMALLRADFDSLNEERSHVL